MNFQPPSNSLTTRDYQFIALVLILFLVIATGLVYANLSLPNGGGDFYVHWVSARGFLFEQTDPYSGVIPARVQELVYEGNAPAGDEVFILDTPFHILLLYFPFALLSDAQLARAIFTLVIELALFALVYLSLKLTDWETPRWFWILFFIFCVLNFYSFQAILSANSVLILGLIYAGMLFALYSEQDELLGGLLAISMYYWEVGLPFLLLIAYRCYKESRTRVFAGFLMLSVVMLIISFLWYPDWLFPYLRAGMNNLRADFGFTIFTALQDIFPAFGRILAWIVIVILVFAFGYEWNASQESDPRRFYWVCCLSLAITPLLGFRTEIEHLSILIIPLALIFSIVYDRWKIGGSLTLLLLIIIFTFPWLLYFINPTQFAQEILFLFLPLFTVIGLYWIRWWALRPPRVWADLTKA
ncbi:MAG: DUF2029 domain-containing protein [Anaerolineales bacterium]|nr:DUF2029 domain-containing protein [Anaerolineales bacterium]